MSKIRQIVFIALFVALISVCAWIQIPYTIPFTMQTFAIFLTLLCLGGRNGTIAIVCYILLGLIGAPVFSGFRSGLGVIMQPTGGYIIGFILIGLAYMIFERFQKRIFQIVSLILGTIIMYLSGTLWFVMVASKSTVTFVSGILTCVVPFIIPDMIKLCLAFFLSYKLEKPLSRVMRKSQKVQSNCSD